MNLRRKLASVPASRAPLRTPGTTAFTLIELSIVLIVIGLVVGGILVGQSLIAAAAVRAQISQIVAYRTAVNTFKGKYGELPGDMSASGASQFGFAAGGPAARNGDGLIEGVVGVGFSDQFTGEPVLFWEDLSAARLIEGTFNTGSGSVQPAASISGAQMDSYFPAAKLGRGHHVFAYGGSNGLNYFAVGGYTGNQASPNYDWLGGPSWTITPIEALSIDAKFDDGFPQSGTVTSQFVGGTWARYDPGPVNPTALQAIFGQCYDNGNVAGVVRTYTVKYAWNAAVAASQINGDIAACILSFQFQ